MFREMIRKRKAISQEECIELLKNEPRGVLSVLGDEGYPYGMPMNFWYCAENGKIYFHSAKKGHKVDAMAKCDKVSFCVYDKGYYGEGGWGLNIKSVIVFGRVKPIDDLDQVIDICRKLSYKYTNDDSFIEGEIKTFGRATLCYEMEIEHMCGKLVNES